MRVADAPLIAPYALNLSRRLAKFPIRISNSHFIRHSGARLFGANPESRGIARYHIEIPGSSPSGRALRGVDGAAPE
jgi:hypothetical protein